MKAIAGRLLLASFFTIWTAYTLLNTLSAAVTEPPPLPPYPVHRDIGYDPLRITVCRDGCDFTSLKAAIDSIDANSSNIISILDGEIEETAITVGEGKTITIIGLGAHRTKIGLKPTVSSEGPLSTRILTINEGANVELRNLTLRGAEAGNDNGGAISVSGSDSRVILDSIHLRNNKAASGGALAISNGAHATVQDSIFEDNMATANGGAIFVDGGELLLKRTFVGYNQAAAGGGIAYTSGADASLIKNSTIAFNKAEASSEDGSIVLGGGAIYIYDVVSQTQSSKLDILFSTISENSTSTGDAGGILLSGGTVTATANIILQNFNQAGEPQACDVGTDQLISAGFNVVSDASCQLTGTLSISGTHDIISDSAIIQTLGNYGGGIPTFGIGLESLAIGLVPTDDCIFNNDQRNVPRIDTDQRCDAGAYEAEKYVTDCVNPDSDDVSSCTQSMVKPDQWIVTENNDPVPDGCQVDDCSLREAVIAAEEFPGRNEIMFATDGPIILDLQGEGEAEMGDLDISGELVLTGNITDVITIDASGLDDRIFDVNPGAHLELAGFTLTGGTVIAGSRGGGAILNQGTFVGEHVLIRQNSAIQANFGWGGAIQSIGGDLTLRNSEIISNTTSSFFSGIHNWNSTMELTGVTIAGNDGANGVIYNHASGGDSVLWMSSVTLAANGKDSNFGLSNRWQNFPGEEDNPEAVISYLRNTVIGSHKDLSCDASGSSENNIANIVSHGFNLTFDQSCTIDTSTDLTGVDPLLMPLSTNTLGKYNGRLVLKPSWQSPLWNQGDTQGCGEIDSRGIGRPNGGRCDIGAIELVASESPNIIYMPFLRR